jgi:hypothetical protein
VVKELIHVSEHERRAPELALALDPRLGLASQFVNVLLFDFVKCAHTGPLVRGIAR